MPCGQTGCLHPACSKTPHAVRLSAQPAESIRKEPLVSRASRASSDVALAASALAGPSVKSLSLMSF